MKSLIQSVTFPVLILGAIAGTTGNPSSGGDPADVSKLSGIVRMMTGAREERVWFTPECTRRDMLVGTNALMVQVNGKARWVAYPAAGRIWVDPPHSPVFETYPEEIRRRFQLVFASRKPVDMEIVKGLPCRKYSWHEPANFIGDVGMEDYDATYWVYDEAAFPLTVRFQHNSSVVSELGELVLGKPVEGKIFQPPDGLTPIRPFRLPEHDFLIRIRTCDENRQYGWTSTQVQTIACSGTSGHLIWEQTYQQADGRNASCSSHEEQLDAKQLFGKLQGELRPPDLFTVKKTGRDRILGFDVDVLVNVIEGLPDQTHWVVDHPSLGTITLKRIERYSGGTRTFEMTSVDIGEITKGEPNKERKAMSNPVP